MSKGVARVALTFVHVGLTLLLAFLCVVLLQPEATFDTGQGYAVMAEMATEDQWACVFGAGAILGTISYFTRSRAFKLCTAAALSAIHAVVGTAIVIANPVSIGSGAYFFIAAMGGFLTWATCHGD
jgi:hypothetical protein